MKEKLLKNRFKTAFVACVGVLAILGSAVSVEAASYSWSSGNAAKDGARWSVPGAAKRTPSFNPGNTTSLEGVYVPRVDSTDYDLTVVEADDSTDARATDPPKTEVSDHQMLSSVQDGYKGSITVTADGATLELVNQELGQSGWLKIVNKQNIPYQISMIVTENGAVPDLTDLRNIVQWLRDSGMGDVDIADASEGRLVFAGLSLLTDQDAGGEYSRFVWDFSGYAGNQGDGLQGMLANWSGADGNGWAAQQVDISVVPEPSTWCMLVVGMFLLGLMVRRRMASSVC